MPSAVKPRPTGAECGVHMDRPCLVSWRHARQLYCRLEVQALTTEDNEHDGGAPG